MGDELLKWDELPDKVLNLRGTNNGLK